MKRVLIALPNDKLGGAEQYLKMICDYFSKSGYLVDVLFVKRRETSDWDDFEYFNNVKLWYTESYTERGGLFFFINNLLKLRKFEYSYIFTSHVHITGLLGSLCRLGILKKKFFVGRESTLIFKRFTGFKLILFKVQYLLGYPILDLLICQTDLMLQQIEYNLPSLAKKIQLVVIPNPVSLTYLSSGFSNTNFNLAQGQFIIAAGRLINEKGFDVLITAFHEVLILFPDISLVIFGEGKEKDRLKFLISYLGLEKNVFLMGYTRDLSNYFQLARLCVVSSLVEGFPNVLLQMMAKNVNIVSTLCAGGIENIKGIFTAQPGDVFELRNALINCLQSNNLSNRKIFDDYLYERQIEFFIKKVDNYLSYNTNVISKINT